MKAYFMTSTGTGVGKTYIAASLARQLPSIRALKPIISGYTENEETDTHILIKAQGKGTPDSISPWRFAAALSPDAAARREGKEVVFSELLEWCRTQMLQDEITLIEGAGGVMSPFTNNHTMLDWMVALRIPVLLVAGSYLGAISHTLTSIAVLKARNIPVQALILNESEESPMPLEETAATIERLSGLKPVMIKRNAVVPFSVLS